LEKSNSIVVVGAGPSGSFSALSAAKLGAKVVVFEEHKTIGVPSHCPGHLSLSSLKRLDLVSLPKEIVENEFKGAVFYSPCGREFSVRFSSPVTCVVDRKLFDRHLADLSMKTGVEYRLGVRVESLVLAGGFVKGVVFSREGEKETFTSNIVIDAEGVSSNLLKKARLPTLNRFAIVNAVHAEVDKIVDVENDCVEVYLGRKHASGFYAWVIPRQDGSAKVGLATMRGNPKEYLQRFMHNHPVALKKLRRSKIVRQSFHPITLGGPIRRTYHNGLLIVGDAASQVKPTTGGGVIMGLTCAKIAAEIACQAIQQNDYSGHFLSRYQRGWQQTIGFDMVVMKQIRLLLNRLSDKKLDKMISLYSQLHLDEGIQKVKDIDFQGKSFIPLLKSPNTWAVVFYSFLASIM